MLRLDRAGLSISNLCFLASNFMSDHSLYFCCSDDTPLAAVLLICFGSPNAATDTATLALFSSAEFQRQDLKFSGVKFISFFFGNILANEMH